MKTLIICITEMKTKEHKTNQIIIRAKKLY